MSYLILNDYKKHIQALNLNQVIGNDQSIVISWQLAAQEKCMSYLKQKYDVAQEFTDTTVWDPTKVYYAKNRVYLDATAYNPESNYGIGVLCLQLGNVYTCSQAIVVPEAFNAAHWTLLGPQYTLYYVGMPQPEFVLDNFYKVGDQVYWKNKVYTAKQNSAIYDQIQYPTLAAIPPSNYFPDMVYNIGQQSNSQWGTGTPFSVPAGTPLTSPLWVQGDNRSQEMVEKCIDIVLYRAHSRISPQNVPEVRYNNYHDAISWLKQAAIGDPITANLPLLQPRRGARMRFGGEPKQQNGY